MHITTFSPRVILLLRIYSAFASGKARSKAYLKRCIYIVKSVLHSIVSIVLRINKIVIVTILLFLVVLLYEAFFTGDVRYYFKKEVQDQDLALGLLRNAAGQADLTNQSLQYLSTIFLRENFDTSTVREGLEGKSISDFLEANVDISYSSSDGTVSSDIKIDVLGMYDTMIGSLLTRFGRRKAIVINTFESDTAIDKYRINLFMYPDLVAVVPVSGMVAKDLFVGSLSHDIGEYRTTYSKDCGQRICFSDVPKIPNSMTNLIEGIDITQRLSLSKKCPYASDLKCAELASKLLRESLEMDDEQTIGHIGLFLSELYRASELVGTGEARETKKAIFSAAHHLNKALANSKSLEAAFSENETIDRILAEQRYSSLDLNAKFIKDLGGYEQANALYMNREYEKALQIYKEIELTAPKWLKGILALKILFGEKRLNGEIATPEMIAKLDNLAKTINNDIYYNVTKGQFLFTKQNREKSDLLQSLSYFEIALSEMPFDSERYAVVVQRASVNYALGKKEQANNEVKAIQEIIKEPDTICNPRYAIVHWSIAEYFDYSGNLPEIKKHLALASLSDSSYFNTQTELKAIKSDGDREIWKSKLGKHLLNIDKGEISCERVWEFY